MRRCGRDVSSLLRVQQRVGQHLGRPHTCAALSASSPRFVSTQRAHNDDSSERSTVRRSDAPSPATTASTATTSAPTTTTSTSSNTSDRDAAQRSHSFAQEFVKPHMDATFLVENYTAPALAAAYQDRCVCPHSSFGSHPITLVSSCGRVLLCVVWSSEYTLRLCAELLTEGKLDELTRVLQPYQGAYALMSVRLPPTRR